MLLTLLLLSCDPVSSAESESESPVIEDETDTVAHYSEPAQCAANVSLGSVEGLTRWPYLQSGTTDGMTVVWGGAEGGLSAELGWGRVDTELTVEATSTLIEGKDGAVIRLWQARAEGLEPGTEYCYRVSVDGVVLTEGLRFRTAPASPEATVKFLVIGDFGSGTQAQQQVHDQMLEYIDGVDLLLTTGDNAYNSGTWDELDQWVFQVNQDILHRVVTFPTPGNHDYRTEDAAPYLASFVLPENAWREKDKERYYTAEWGPLKIIGLDTEDPLGEVSSEMTDDQVDWLDAQLKASDQPWVLPLYHKPGVEGHATRGPDIFVLGYFVPLFEQYGVRLVMQGHNHHYERFKPLVDGAQTVQGKGVTYLVTGGGGRSLYSLGAEERRVVGVEEHHFLVGEADECRISIRAISKTGEQLDHFALLRC